MTDRDPVLDALLAALDNGDGPELRVAVAQRLVEIDRHDEALVHAQAALAIRPDDVQALRLAALAADATERRGLGAGYRRLLTVLEPGVEGASGDVAAVEPAQPEPGGGEPGESRAAGSTDTERPAASDPEPAMTGTEPPGDRADPPRPDAVSVEGPTDDEFDSFLREVMAEDQAGRIRLDDVGGMAQVKAELERRFFLPIRNPEIQKAFGSPLNGGLLLYGPPGCGKTFLARAIAGELDARFIPVTLHDTLDMWIGQSERNLHGIFDVARRSTPTVLFLDEVDAIGQRRSRSANASMRGVVAQLLNELDGAADRNDGVFVIAATNTPWDVDPALRRPGRFDRTVLVLPPDEEARVAVLDYHLRDRPTVGLDLRRVAARTSGYTGADLMLICQTSVELAMERAIKRGRVEPIDQKLLEKAAKSVKPSIGPWLDTARNFVTFANSDGEYDDLERFLSSRKR